MADGPMFHFQTDFPNGCISLGKAVADIAPDHGIDDLVLIKSFLGLVHGRDHLAVADDGNAICNVCHFVELVRYENAGHAPLLELEQQVKQLFRFGVIE